MSDATTISIRPVSPLDPDSLELMNALTSELSELYDGDGGAESFDPAGAEGNQGVFVIASLNGKAIGCGAIRPFADGVAELKRMFVSPEARGMGVGRKLLETLELLAGNMNYRAIRLETGLKQPQAISLYASSGYTKVACHGKYSSNPQSICFEKELSK